MPQIKELAVEKIEPENTDFLPIQEVSGITKKITRANFLKGIGESSAIVTSGALVDYKFLEESGTVANDSSGLNNHGVINNFARPDWLGIGLDLSNCYVDIPSNSWFSGGFTIEVCVYPRSYANFSKIVSFGNGAFNNNILLNATSGTSGISSLQIIRGGNSEPNINAGSTLDLYRWTYIQAVFTNGVGSLYRNTSLWGRFNNQSPNNVTRTQNYIGKSHWADPNFDGIITAFRFYNRALNRAERLNNFLSTKGELSANGIIL